MNPRVCVCCGELISERGGALLPNPNICASCASLLDAMDDGTSWHPQHEPETVSPTAQREPVSNPAEKTDAAPSHGTPSVRRSHR